MTATRYIRNSEVGKFQRCMRSWYLGYHRNFEPNWGQRKFPATYDTGTAVHAGLQAHYLGQDPIAAIDLHAAEVEAHLDPMADEKAWAKVWKMAKAMVEHYPAWLDAEGHDIGEETISLETQMEIEIVPGIVLYGTPDRIVRTPMGIIVEDWKSVSRIERPFMLESNWQLLNYLMFAKMAFPGENIIGARHRQFNRSMHTARATAPQYGQHMVHFVERRLEHHFRMMREVAVRMANMHEIMDWSDVPELDALPTHIGQCSWDCSFASVCTLMDDGGDWEAVLEIDYRPREDNR